MNEKQAIDLVQKTFKSALELFIVHLKNDTSLERARTMQRNFVASYLQKDMKDAALVAFVSKNPADWRFSFIKSEGKESSKIKSVRTKRPARAPEL